MRFEIQCDVTEDVINSILVELESIGLDEEIEFNFNNAGFMNCFALTFLVILVNQLANDHVVYVFFSNDKPLLYYLSRMGFFKELNDTIRIIPSAAKNPKFVDNYRLTNDTILEITPVKNIDIYGIINHVVDTLTNILNYDCEYVANITVLLSELLTNVIDHSQNSTSGYVALQTYKKAGFADLVVVDKGIGILNSLKENELLSLDNDIKAIKFAVQKGVSRFAYQNRGLGLNTCLELANVYRGYFYIRSGSGQLISKNYRINTQEVSFFSGTQVSIRLPFEYKSKWRG